MYNEIALAVVVTLLVVGSLWLAYIFLLAGGPGRYFEARGHARRYLREPDYAERVRVLNQPPPPPEPVKPSAEPVRLLAVLQREGRLLDFLLEDIEGYPNEQIGAAVRDIHRNCKKAITEHLVLEPVLQGQEGAVVEVPAGFDPSAVQLLGNVTGQPPFRGTLVHKGWRVAEIKLAPPPEGQDEFVVQPAEVELP